VSMFKQKFYRWQDVKVECQADIPDSGGCYAIYLNGRLVYIGQSDNLSLRIRSYKFKTFQNDEGVSFFSIVVGGGAQIETNIVLKIRACRQFGHCAMVERRLIRRLLPPFNRTTYVYGVRSKLKYLSYPKTREITSVGS
jgi:hypothetical protein